MWSIVIPNWKPPSDNRSRGRHWRASKDATAEVCEFLTAYNAKVACPKIRPDYRPKRVVAIAVYVKGPKPDPQNLAKNFCDGMKAAGLIVDDSAKWLRWVTPVVLSADEKGPRTEILIRDDDEELEERGGKLFSVNREPRSLKALPDPDIFG